MTDLLATADPQQPSTTPAPRRPRRRAVIAAGAVLLLGAVAVALAVWLPGGLALRSADVLLDARPFTCADAGDVTTYATDGGGDRVLVPALRMHPGLDCTMTVVVRNDSDVDIAVDRITVPMAGPVNGWGLHADRSTVQGIRATSANGGLDAVLDYAQHAGGAFPVAAHSVQRFPVHLSWSGGCMDDRSAGVFADAPIAVLSAGPWHVRRSWSGAGYAVIGGEDTIAARCHR